MEERMRFVLEALEGWDSMSELCARCGISRRVGYKWIDRYEREGLEGLADRSRAPHRQRAATPPEVVEAIVALRKDHPTWGPRKLKAWLERAKPRTRWPSCSTIGAILKREGLTRPRRRRTLKPGVWRPARTGPDVPNRVWTADFKGEFRLGSGRLCYPLTVLDAHSRFLLECRGLPSTANAGARAGFERVFRGYGLPEVIRTDNGVPFSTQAVAGLSQLAVWWIRLGIRLERGRPRHPEDNGAHERMHRTLKAEATRAPARTRALQ
ncbi:MAG: helix-turn-helix domain-containing protein [Gemmatimonadota bacterium]